MKNFNKIFRPQSLRWQILFRSYIVFLILLILMGISQYTIMRQSLLHSTLHLVESRFRNLNPYIIHEINDNQTLKAIAPLLVIRLVDRDITVAILNDNGEVVASSGNLKNSLLPPLLPQKEYEKLIQTKDILRGFRFIRNPDGKTNMVVWRPIGRAPNVAGLIQLSTPIQPIQEMLRRQLTIYITASLIILLIGMAIGGTVLRKTLNPLYKMTNTVGHIAVGKLDTRLDINSGQEEINKLAVAFNDMLDRIETSFKKEQYAKEQMRRFVSDASHELRTPLTSIHGFVEVLLRGAAKNEEQLKLALNSILTESERLTKLVNDLLLLTKLDQKLPVDMRKENLKNIVDEIYPQLKMIAGQRKINCEINDDVIVYANRDQMKQVIFNLVQNAVQHTDEKKGIINIIIKREIINSKGFAALKVTDNGTGISPEDMDKIFERFYRSDSHRSRRCGGYGLGLAIVKSIVTSHGGKITVDSELGKGSTFTVYLNLV